MSETQPPLDPQHQIEQLQREVERLGLELEKQQHEQEIGAVRWQQRGQKHREQLGGLRLWSSDGLRLLAVVAVAILIAFMVLTAYYRMQDERKKKSPPNTTPAATSDDALNRANDAIDAANRASDLAGQVMNFLQVAGFLIALALGAAALYGFRQANETSEEFRNERKELRDELDSDRKDLKDDMQRETAYIKETEERLKGLETNLGQGLDLLQQSQRDLEKLPQALQSLERLQEVIEGTLESNRQESERLREQQNQTFNDLFQADQELRLKNFGEAHDAVERVLARDPNNLRALYIAGWIEFQYIRTPNHLEQGAAHLEKALKLSPEWWSAVAAYGVVLRRLALQLSGPERDSRLADAESYLRRALIHTPDLLDLNLESFNGPLAGLLRDRGDIDKAIEAYERACRVTPGSSYPHGNLAALYLLKGRDTSESSYRKQALDLFEQTANLAKAELALVPNDYYHTMDIVMSELMSTQRPVPGEYLAQSNPIGRALDAPLGLHPTPEMLSVSLRGWTNLLDYCPPDWTDLITSLTAAVFEIARTLIDQAVQVGQSDEALYRQAHGAVQKLFEKTARDPIPAGFLRDREREWQRLSEACPQEWADAHRHIEAIQALISSALENRPAGA